MDESKPNGPHRWKKGECPNPKGRPKGRSVGDELRKLVEEADITGATKKTNKRLLAESMVKLALGGDSRLHSLIMKYTDPDPEGIGDALASSRPVSFTLSLGGPQE